MQCPDKSQRLFDLPDTTKIQEPLHKRPQLPSNVGLYDSSPPHSEIGAANRAVPRGRTAAEGPTANASLAEHMAAWKDSQGVTSLEVHQAAHARVAVAGKTLDPNRLQLFQAGFAATLGAGNSEMSQLLWH
mmetsp:Transcript_52820/g.98949  ORF Transcript_52820/g.98949 Transcript_52820/m.98949 type:complete len:131 (-) Transcript_52820:475-867(-)